MGPYLRIVRIGNVAVSGVGTVVGALVAGGSSIVTTESTALLVLLAALSTSCVTAAGNVLNDLGDQSSDRRNHPDRALVTGAITPRAAQALTVGLFVAGVVLVAPWLIYRPALGPILLAAILALLAYEWWFKAEGLPGNLLVAGLTAGVFLYGGAAAGNLLPVLPFAIMATLATLSREVIKDMEDAGGDLDRQTFPKTRGMGASSLVARIAVGAAIGLSLLAVPLLFPVVSIAEIIYIAIVLAADGLFVMSVLHLPERLHEEQTLSKVAMTVALAAFVAAAFR
ncbi:MAG: geranylgeranylglycerol-phosphate geranylgeranyltransferase [Thermoplasmata archaeon]|nr:geranylgeranylglycerol-phosphate geranylgeranyltransferase [Thermoplasmata archaeon]